MCIRDRYAVLEDTVAGMVDMFPIFKHLKLMRHWAGAIDFATDASPIIDRTPIPGLYITCGWYGGFKSIPIGGRSFAHLLARDEPHPLAAAFTLERFRRLGFVMEAGTVAAR